MQSNYLREQFNLGTSRNQLYIPPELYEGNLLDWNLPSFLILMNKLKLICQKTQCVRCLHIFYQLFWRKRPLQVMSYLTWIHMTPLHDSPQTPTTEAFLPSFLAVLFGQGYDCLKHCKYIFHITVSIMTTLKNRNSNYTSISL